jgi:hypothetical protein
MTPATTSPAFDITEFHAATEVFMEVAQALEEMSLLRRVALLRYAFPTLDKFTWEFDDDAWGNDQVTVAGEFAAHFTDGSEVALGSFSDWPEGFDELRPHLRAEVTTEEETEILTNAIYEFMDHYQGDSDLQEATVLTADELHDRPLVLPAVAARLETWSSPTIPWPPAPPEDAKKGSSRKKKR